jgi:hypothetical protein
VAGTVRWGQDGAAFELASSSSEVLARAQVVFRPWPDDAGQPPCRRWRIEPGFTVLDEAGTPLSTGVGLDPAVRQIEYLAVQALVDAQPPRLTFHGALVGRDDRGVLLLGPAESGKSTLACVLWQRGFQLLGDDVAIVDAGTGLARSAPRRVALRAGSRTLLGEALWARLACAPAFEATTEGCVFHPAEVDGRPPARQVRLRAAVFLARGGDGPRAPGAEPLAPAHALLALLPWASPARSRDPGAVIRQLEPLARGLRVHDLARASLPAMADAVERLTAAAA